MQSAEDHRNRVAFDMRRF